MIILPFQIKFKSEIFCEIGSSNYLEENLPLTPVDKGMSILGQSMTSHVYLIIILDDKVIFLHPWMFPDYSELQKIAAYTRRSHVSL